MITFITCFLTVCVIGMFAPPAGSDSSHYCPTPYTTKVTKYKCANGFSRRRCCYYVTYEIEPKINHKACCPGYKGELCNIPICDPPCQINAVCTAPGNCYSPRDCGKLHPPVEDIRVIDANTYGTKATIAWSFPRSCYHVTSVRIVFADTKSTRDIQIESDKKTHKLHQLIPLTRYHVDVYLVYEGGVSSMAVAITFKTANLQSGEYPSGVGLNVGTILGIVMSALTLFLLTVIILILLIHHRQHIAMIPPAIRDRTSRIWNRLSTFYPVNRSNNMDQGHRMEIEDRVQFTNNAFPQSGSNNITKTSINMIKENMVNEAYIGGSFEYDYVRFFGEMETDPNAQWKVSKDRVIIGDPLPNVKGRFADIKMATLHDKNGTRTVVGKMNKTDAKKDDKLLMKAKMNFLATGISRHEHILNFVASVSTPKETIILTEYCDEGRLLDWLRAQVKVTIDTENSMISFSTQIAQAMQHLHENRILHRRLGARNVLLKSTNKNQLIAKVTGFGPMKGEHCGRETINKKEKVPIKWMAPEQVDVSCGKTRQYTLVTDVWSYGITLHEIYSKGDAPYHGMTVADFKKKVKTGYRMPRCERCPQFVYDQIMLPCWYDRPDTKPEFTTIVSDMNHYFDGKDIQEGYYYDGETQPYENV